MPNRKFFQQGQRASYLQIIGAILFLVGIITLMVVGLQSYGVKGKPEGNTDNSQVVAIAFYFIMNAFVLLFPDILKTPDGASYSTMRVSVYIVVGVFAFLSIKIGWNCKTFSEFNISTTWGIIVTAALGSKAVQSLGESNMLGKAEEKSQSLFKANTFFNRVNSSSPDLLHDSSDIHSKPPDSKPDYIK